MNSAFVTCIKNFPREITRKLAKGHSGLVISNNVKQFSMIKITTKGTDLFMDVDETAEGNPEAYTILCKEFGLDDLKKFNSVISVIFLDEGYMLVTLRNGAIALNIEMEDNEFKLLAPSIGVDNVPSFMSDDIFWVNSETLMAYHQYFKDFKSYFVYDFEFFFSIGGTNANGLHTFRLRSLADNDVDLSLGLYAKFLEEKQKKDEFKEVTKMMNKFNETTSAKRVLEFDDEDEDEDDEYDEY